jgi:hypothetical protein
MVRYQDLRPTTKGLLRVAASAAWAVIQASMNATPQLGLFCCPQYVAFVCQLSVRTCRLRVSPSLQGHIGNSGDDERVLAAESTARVMS